MIELAVLLLSIKTVDCFHERIVIDHLAVRGPENTRARKIELRDLQSTVAGRGLHVESSPLWATPESAKLGELGETPKISEKGAPALLGRRIRESGKRKIRLTP